MGLRAFAQAPANDLCANASSVSIGSSGFGLGIFVGDTVNLTNATVQVGEVFHNTLLAAGNDKKSVWYKFSLATHRAVNLELKQPTNILPLNAVGFTVYKTSNCMPNLSQITPAKLTPLNQFGSSYNPCLDAGDYYVQVSSKLNANSNIFIELTITTPGVLIDYDLKNTRYDFGVIGNTWNEVNYDVGCQTIDDSSETCPALGSSFIDYSQSTWFTFTTGNYVDLIRLEFGEIINTNGGHKVAWNIFQNDCALNPNGLIYIDGCNTTHQINFDNSNPELHWTGKNYLCTFLPNTTYSIQVFYHKAYINTVGLRLRQIGTISTNAPHPSDLAALPGATNALGSLPMSVAGITTTANDNLACNSRIINNACGTVNPSSGIINSSAAPGNFTLGTWYSFSLSNAANVTFNTSSRLLKRLYIGDVLGNCNLTNPTSFINSTYTVFCLPAGNYSIQLSGIMDTTGRNPFDPLLSQLSAAANISINVQKLGENNNFSLTENNLISAQSRVYRFNSFAPLASGTNYISSADTFKCNNTILPNGSLCNVSNTKAMYREFNISTNGFVTLSGGNIYLQYKLFKGDAQALANAQNIFSPGQLINSLIDITGCINLSGTPVKVCVTPGTYTLVTLGDQGDVGIIDHPSVRFDIANTLFSNPAAPNNLGSIVSFPVNGIQDIWSCIDNPLTIAGQTPCNGATKQIYREFFIPNPQYLNISNNGFSFRLFTGQISNGTANPNIPGYGNLGCMTIFNADVSSCPRILPAGWYSVVVYASGGSYSGPNYVGGNIGNTTNISIFLTSPPFILNPVYNRPYKAYKANSGSPLVWGPNSGTSAIPNTGRSYTFGTEHFNCINDLPFANHPVNSCNASNNRVAYFVFSLNQESYVKFTLPNSFTSKLYNLDVTTADSLLMPSTMPIQSCINTVNSIYDNLSWTGEIELCRMQPGVYTLVVFASDAHIGSSLTPLAYVEKIENSRFDHAINAYDFGNIPLNGVEYYGKIGDTNPLDIGRAPSNDFFTCKTGAQPNDPANFCWDGLYQNGAGNSTVPYPMVMNHPHYNGPNTYPPVRRNLWYTFTVSGPGTVNIRVVNKTSGASAQYPFTVYKSDENGNLSFASLVASGLVDSTLAQGLSLVTPNGNSNYNFLGMCSSNSQTRSFAHGDICMGNVTERYYILVDHHSHIELNNQVDVSVTFSPFSGSLPSPLYNRPYKAYVANLYAPLTWGPNTGTPEIPLTSNSYTLGTEHFLCNDLPFASHPVTGCVPVNNRVAYYVFTLSQESYLRIKGIPVTMNAKVFNLDVLTDSLLLTSAVPIQNCISTTDITYDNVNWKGEIEVCRMQPGTYTLVVFANDSHFNTTLTPVIVVEKVEESRFDHAINAYDFGNVPGNNTEIFGKIGDVNPLEPNRAPSNDFFSCKTGAQYTDPSNFCWDGIYQNGIGNSTVSYPMPVNSNLYTGIAASPPVRRNLWYTFTVSGTGVVTVNVINKTLGNLSQYPYSIYRSDASGTIPFSTLISTGQLDSTFIQGLTLVTPNGNSNYGFLSNGTPYCVSNSQQKTFVNTGCTGASTRYYIIVDHNTNIELNNQVEVGIKFDSQPGQYLLYDHYSHANLINGLNETSAPYTQVVLSNGTYSGATGYFACATHDSNDPNTCGNRTLWYKLIVGATGKIKLNFSINGDTNNTFYNNNNIQLYKQIIYGDSTINGLIQIPLNTINAIGKPWGEACMDVGIYYILVTGCNYTIETVNPNVVLTSEAGDYCSNPIEYALVGSGTVLASANINCHTMGFDYGEDGSDMSCLFGPANYKSTWFKVTIDAASKMDITFKLTENTSAFPNQIRYRLLFGSCGALSSGPCNTDALTEFTLNCMPIGIVDYYIQVVSPITAIGNIQLEVSTVVSADQNCAPTSLLAPIANFSPGSACDGEAVTFNNYSSSGSLISYLWNFGCCSGANSVLENPTFVYPVTNAITSYPVTLVVTNNLLNLSDSITLDVVIYPKPQCNISVDAPAPPLLEMGIPYNFHANATNTIITPPTSYLWDFDNGQNAYSPDAVMTYNTSGTFTINLSTINGTCVSNCNMIVTTAPAYTGGFNDGFSNSSYLNSGQCISSEVYRGNTNDGFSSMSYQNPGSCDLNSIYVGNINEGFDVGIYLNTGLCLSANAAYLGEINDGFSSSEFLNSGSCTPPSAYTGSGLNDGFSYNIFVSPTNCLVNNIAYTGNENDGSVSIELISSQPCIIPSPYSGSNDDGFTMGSFINGSSCSQNQSAFLGNNNDGFGFSDFTNPGFCASTISYIGNLNDGFATGIYNNPSSCMVSTIAFIGSNNDGSALMAYFNNSICTSANDPYFGNNNDGFSVGYFNNVGTCIPITPFTGGGNNDGFSISNYLSPTVCLTTTIAYNGINNDGFANGLFFNLTCPLSPYLGSQNDGFAKANFLNLSNCNASIYSGSTHDGFAFGVYNNLNTCSSYIASFTGNNNDGFTNGEFLNSGVCNTFTSPYAGNIEDGFSIGVYNSNSLCSVDIAYQGNNNDGYALGIFESTTSCLSNVTAYLGNINDGAHNEILLNTGSCNIINAMYNGSLNDGFATSVFYSTTSCAIYSYLGNNNDGFAQGIFYNPTGCSIGSYIGSVNDGFSSTSLYSSSTCNSNSIAYTGNSNDGFSVNNFISSTFCAITAYTGYSYDGFSAGSFQSITNCQSSIAYYGNNDDGFAIAFYTNNSTCLPVNYSFVGSVMDGFSNGQFFNAGSCGVSGAFFGNLGDGHALNSYENTGLCTVSNIAYLSNFYDGNASNSFINICGSPLPISLLYFNAECENEYVKLNWSSASETNNDFYTIERSENGITFQNIGTIKGAGNSFNTLFYSFKDLENLQSIAYYRLKQTDYDGNFRTSNLISIDDCYQYNNIGFAVFPNPTDGNFKVKSFTHQQLITFEIFDVLGQLIYSTKVNDIAPKEQIQFDLSQHAKGIYVLKITVENSNFNQVTYKIKLK